MPEIVTALDIATLKSKQSFLKSTSKRRIFTLGYIVESSNKPSTWVAKTTNVPAGTKYTLLVRTICHFPKEKVSSPFHNYIQPLLKTDEFIAEK